MGCIIAMTTTHIVQEIIGIRFHKIPPLIFMKLDDKNMVVQAQASYFHGNFYLDINML